MQASLFDQGVTLMLVGMGTVFVFLTVLVVAMTVMARIIGRLKPPVADGVSEEEIAAITAAIAQHRHKQS
ncbi:MAG: OadG family transporter subunit [Gammaproteobacteria bacterium]|nr:OadG family transporter subunit [Gammaproteobacteria bacterium]